jgi:hypothetical protein
VRCERAGGGSRGGGSCPCPSLCAVEFDVVTDGWIGEQQMRWLLRRRPARRRSLSPLCGRWAPREKARGSPSPRGRPRTCHNPTERLALKPLFCTAKLIERCSHGVEDQGAEEALWGMKKSRIDQVSFGKSRLTRAALPFSAPSLYRPVL